VISGQRIKKDRGQHYGKKRSTQDFGGKQQVGGGERGKKGNFKKASNQKEEKLSVSKELARESFRISLH